MGRNHVRILASLPGAELVGVYDARPEIAEALAQEHGTRAFARLDDLAGEVEAAVVAAPTVAHPEIGCGLLGKGLHVLVEKPIAASLAEADRLIEAADGRVLAVGHVEFFNPAVQALVGLGVPPRFVEVQRLAVFTPRSLDVDVVLDLMIHDLQILHALDPSPVAEVRATGIAVLSPRIDIANARVELASGCVANLTASRDLLRARPQAPGLPVEPLLLARLPCPGDPRLPPGGGRHGRGASCPTTSPWTRPSPCAASSKPSSPPAGARTSVW